MLKILVFWIFNSALPSSDVGSDQFTFYDLYKSQHYKWAAVTLVLMFNPFLFHTGVFFYDFIKAKCNAESFDTRARLKKLPMHFPFFLPLINCYNTWRLYRLRFGMKGFDDRNWKDVEEIQDQAGTAGMFESFTEAGPQSVIQLVIILSTGRISTAQKFGLPLSVISLTMASSRAFFIQRSRDERDPDPAMKTLLFRIYPRMLVIVTNSIILWTTIGGLVSRYIFSGIGLCFVNVYVSLCAFPKLVKGKAGAIGAIITLAYVNTHVYVVVGIMMGFFTELTTFLVLFFFSLCISAGLTVFKFRKKIFHCGTSKPLPANSSEEISKELLEEILVDVSKSPEHPPSNIGDLEINDSEEEDSRDSHFRLISGLTSVWLPCVVGSQHHLFLTSAMLSMTNKICLLVLTLLLEHSGSIHTNVFLLWCTWSCTDIALKRQNW